jgi:hypothetical protein
MRLANLDDVEDRLAPRIGFVIQRIGNGLFLAPDGEWVLTLAAARLFGTFSSALGVRVELDPPMSGVKGQAKPDVWVCAVVE